jgi:hypothetical protein
MRKTKAPYPPPSRWSIATPAIILGTCQRRRRRFPGQFALGKNPRKKFLPASSQDSRISPRKSSVLPGLGAAFEDYELAGPYEAAPDLSRRAASMQGVATTVTSAVPGSKPGGARFEGAFRRATQSGSTLGRTSPTRVQADMPYPK